MKHIVIILFATVLVSVAILALGTDTPARAAPAPVPASIPSAQVTETCSLTMTWKFREDHTSYHVTSFNSTFNSAAKSGTQTIAFEIKDDAYNPLSQWTDVFSVAGFSNGLVITLTASGDLPNVNFDPVGGDTQPPQVRCYYSGESLSTSGTRINNYQSVFTATTATYTKCSIGHYPWEGREATTYHATGHTYNYAYYLSFSEAICQTECGLVFTNTHFIVDAGWIKGGATSWTLSEYHLPDGSSLSRGGNFTADAYNVAVQAKSATGVGVLSMGLGESTQAMTVTTTAYAWYTGTFLLGITGTLNLTTTAVGEQIDLHQICVNPTNLTSSCYVLDWHFTTSTVWIPQMPYAVHEPSIWILNNGGYIYQNMMLSQFSGRLGPYYFELRAKASAPSDVDVMVNELTGDTVSVATTDYAIYSGTIDIPNEPNISIKIDNQSANAVTVDYICLYPYTSITPDGSAPCGLTQADVDKSARYIINGGFETGRTNVWPFPECGSLSSGFPLGGGVNCSLLQKITSESWSGSLTGLGSLGVARTGWNLQGWSVGLVPYPLNNGMSQQINNSEELADGFNIAFRVRRTYANGRLIVNAQTVPETPVGQWTDYMVYNTGFNYSLAIASMCSSGMCADPVADKTPDAAQVDSIYIVPGPEMTCGVVVTNPVTPPGDCINPDSRFQSLSTWNRVNGATVVDGQAILPAGGYIQEMVPLSDGTNQGNATGLQVGQSYSITLAAKLQNYGSTGSLSVVVGASTPGSTIAGVASVTSQSLPETFGFDFTLTSDMLSNGSAMPLRVLSDEDGTTVIVYYVCIRNEGGTSPPGGDVCLGTWKNSAGGYVLTTTISPPAFVYNDLPLIAGNTYNVHAAGSFDAPVNGRLTIVYHNPSGASPSIDVSAPTDFDIVRSFVAPAPSGDGVPEIRIYADQDLTYSALCLTENAGVPVVTPPPSPLPYPECAQVLRDPAMTPANFFYLPKYGITPEYSGTLDSAAYAAELIYNYAIYPLACTELSIANWTYAAYHGWLEIFDAFADKLWDYLDQILAAIRALKPIVQDPWDWLKWLLELLALLFQILAKILELIWGMFVNMMKSLFAFMRDLRTETPMMYQIVCEGDEKWMCLGIASVMTLDRDYGDWLNILANLCVFCLSFAMLWWGIGQVRSMFQPEAGDSKSG